MPREAQPVPMIPFVVQGRPRFNCPRTTSSPEHREIAFHMVPRWEDGIVQHVEYSLYWLVHLAYFT